MRKDVTVSDMELHPEFLVKNGKREFAILPYEEFELLQEMLEDARDLLELREAKAEEADAPTMSLEEVKKRLGL
jgi:PHD/YefM family antitoxin component YafN of YafNO toxin-antitoxin module